jgi:hypothetical protein
MLQAVESLVEHVMEIGRHGAWHTVISHSPGT